MKRIETFADAIDYLGGNAAVAAWLQIPENHVATMKHRGRPPRGCMLHFYMTLRERGADPSPAVFGLQSFDHLIMPKLRARKAPRKPMRRERLAAAA